MTPIRRHGRARRSILLAAHGHWWSDDLGGRDPDAEAFQPDIMAFARRIEPDRGDTEVSQDLGAKTGFPAIRPRAPAPRHGLRRHRQNPLGGPAPPRGPLADADGPFSAGRPPRQRPWAAIRSMIAVIGSCLENTSSTTDSRCSLTGTSTPSADVAEDDGQMMHRVPGQLVGIGPSRDPQRVFHIEAVDVMDQGFLALPVGNQVGHRHLLEAMFDGEIVDLGSTRHCAVIN